jgi:acyl dehydratase
VLEQRFLDDFKPGEVFTAPSRTLSDTHYILFSAITGDAHPIHYDREYAKARGLPGPLAHGLLLTGMTAFGAAAISHTLADSMIAMLGTSMRFMKAATTGDTVSPEFEVSAIEPKDATRGILKLAVRLFNQRRELLLQGEHVLMLKRRPPAA